MCRTKRTAIFLDKQHYSNEFEIKASCDAYMHCHFNVYIHHNLAGMDSYLKHIDDQTALHSKYHLDFVYINFILTA